MENEVTSKMSTEGEAQTDVCSDRIIDEVGTTIAEPHQLPRRPRRTRKDKTHRHAIRHGILSRYPLEVLERLGVNVRTLRQLERELRAELKLSGAVARLLFASGQRIYGVY